MSAKLKMSYCDPPISTLYALGLLPTKKELSMQFVTTKENTVEAELTVLDGSCSTLRGTDYEICGSVCASISSLKPLVPPNDEMLYWSQFSQTLSNNPMKLCKGLNQYLSTRTFLVGHTMTLADIFVFASFVVLLGGRNIDKSIKEIVAMSHLNRWLKYMRINNPIDGKVMKVINGHYSGKFGTTETIAAKKTNAPAATAVAKSSGSINLYEGKLPNAEMGKVVTRFPPEPSGYLHIGHAKAAVLNDYYAKYYKGRLIIRFDDTNPKKEKEEFEDSILADLKLLDIHPTGKVTHTSDYFDLIEEKCEQLIRDGIFYCDDTPLETMRAERGEGIESKCRNNPVDENLRRWQEMKKGTPEGINNCVRAKIDMCSKNKCMRDPVMYRCVVDTPHHVHGTKYKVYPMYDFACPIVDSIEGVTHAMRTNEYADRIPQYEWVIKTLNLRPVIIYEFSRLNLIHTVLSKRKLTWLVETGVVEGWDDPRFPTVRGIIRRGLEVDALKDFLFEQGPSKNANLMEWDKIWTKNKQILDPKVPRFMGVDKECGIPVVLTNGPEKPEQRKRDWHPKNPAVGTGMTAYSSNLLLEKEDAEASKEGEEVTLMRWCNAIIEKIERSGSDIKCIKMKLNPDGDFKKTERKLHWVSVAPEFAPVDVLLREYDNLIIKAKPEEDDKMEDIINRDSLFETVAAVESGITMLNVGDKCQLERRGYFRVDKKDGNKLVMIKIPDGKQKPMSVVQGKLNKKNLGN